MIKNSPLIQTYDETVEYWYYSNGTHWLSIVVNFSKSEKHTRITGTGYSERKYISMNQPRIFTEKNLYRNYFISKEELIKEFEELCKTSDTWKEIEIIK